MPGPTPAPGGGNGAGGGSAPGRGVPVGSVAVLLSGAGSVLLDAPCCGSLVEAALPEMASFGTAGLLLPLPPELTKVGELSSAELAL